MKKNVDAGVLLKTKFYTDRTLSLGVLLLYYYYYFITTINSAESLHET